MYDLVYEHVCVCMILCMSMYDYVWPCVWACMCMYDFVYEYVCICMILCMRMYEYVWPCVWACMSALRPYVRVCAHVRNWAWVLKPRVGHNCVYTPYLMVCLVISLPNIRKYTPYLTVCLVICLPKMPYIHRIYIHIHIHIYGSGQPCYSSYLIWAGSLPAIWTTIARWPGHAARQSGWSQRERWGPADVKYEWCIVGLYDVWIMYWSVNDVWACFEVWMMYEWCTEVWMMYCKL
jgi:hypothetical protein